MEEIKVIKNEYKLVLHVLSLFIISMFGLASYLLFNMVIEQEVLGHGLVLAFLSGGFSIIYTIGYLTYLYQEHIRKYKSDMSTLITSSGYVKDLVFGLILLTVFTGISSILIETGKL